MRPCPGASYTSGVLHVTIAGELSLPSALSQFRRLSKNRPFDHPEIQTFTCRSIDLEGPDLDVEADGEIAGGLPARLWVRDSGLLMRMPS
jgi:diacylglycerol kinase family enzyme